MKRKKNCNGYCKDEIHRKMTKTMFHFRILVLFCSQLLKMATPFSFTFILLFINYKPNYLLMLRMPIYNMRSSLCTSISGRTDGKYLFPFSTCKQQKHNILVTDAEIRLREPSYITILIFLIKLTFNYKRNYKQKCSQYAMNN